MQTSLALKIHYPLPNMYLQLVQNIHFHCQNSQRQKYDSSNQIAGYRSVRWDATNDVGELVSAGMYVYLVQVGDYSQTKKMVLLK